MTAREKGPTLSFQCPKLWENFSGSDTTRFCKACGYIVHNLSRLSKTERAALLEKSREQRVCVAYHQNLAGDLLVSPPEDRKMRTAARLAAVAAGAIALSSCSAEKHNDNNMVVGMICPPEESK